MDINKPKALVLGSGGYSGFLELGALYVFERNGLLTDIETYSGSSIGAIISLLLSIGYTVSEIISEGIKLDLFEDVGSITLESIKKNTGVLDFSLIFPKLEKIITSRLKCIPSLKGLHKMTGKRLIVVSTKMSETCDPEYIDYISYPDLSCIDAIIFSIAIPFVFSKIEYNGSVYIDGALTMPFPIEIVDDSKTEILGISVHTSYSPKNLTDNTNIFSKILKYSFNILKLSNWQLEKRLIKSASKMCKIFILETDNIDIIGATLTVGDIAEMVLSGYRQVSVSKILDTKISKLSVVNIDDETYYRDSDTIRIPRDSFLIDGDDIIITGSLIRKTLRV